MNSRQFRTWLIFSVVGFIAYGFTHALSEPTMQNNSPVVRITSPRNKGTFEWGSVIPYAVMVSDREEGESKYGEIPANEVLVWAKYLEDSSLVSATVGEQLANVEPMLWMARSTCFNCHTIRGPLIGPSFAIISERYRNTVGSIDTLVARVRRGSLGNWGDVQMPSHEDLPTEKLNRIVRWILSNSNDPDEYYAVGISGAYTTRKKPAMTTGKEVYVITAAYTDHGLAGKGESSKQGKHSVVISPKK